MDILLLALRIALALILYAFLALLLVFLYRDMNRAPSVHPALPLGGQLVVVGAVEEGVAEGTAFPLLPVTSIGRAPANTIVVPDTYASARHALVSWRDSQWYVEDLGSRNGTLLNGEPVSTPTVLSAGDIIGVGQTQFRLELDIEHRTSE